MPCSTHPNSLVPISVHNPALVCLVKSRLTIEIVEYVARHAAKCVAVHHPQNASPILPPGVASLSKFIVRLLSQCNISTATLLTCLIYFDRLRAKMSHVHHATESAMHRVFFATLIVASKYLNDSSPKNVHWAAYAVGYFDLAEINTMEHQLLKVLNFDLRFTEEDACLHFAPFMTSPASQASTRASALDKVAKASQARAHRQPSSIVPPPSYSSSQSSSSAFVSSVRGLAKRLSLAHIRPESNASSTASSTTTSPIPRALSSRSSSTCSSDVASLMDDSGSSSGSSSGWTSSESESEYDDNIEPRVYSATATSYREYCPNPNDLESSRSKKPFILRPSIGYRSQQHLANSRTRKPSDTSSIRTITAHSPITTSSTTSTFHGRRPSKRTTSGSMFAMEKEGSTLNTSMTMPTFPQSASSGGFLSRMWGAAKGQTSGQDRSALLDGQFASSNSLKRLVLVHSRSTRTGGAFEV